MLRTLSAASMLAVVALTGCGLGTPATFTPETQHLNIIGSVHGGQQPVSGARIYIFQANNTGYGNKSVDLTAYNRLNGIVPIALGATYDSVYGAYYFTSTANGSFTITGDYTCAGTGPVYILATQGNPGLGAGKTNPALAELAVLGSCANFATLSPTLQVGISEVSTVTGVYALAGYMTAPNAMSSNGANSALSLTGITNSANTALGLTNLATGTPLATTVAGATLPVAKINLLADILAACINTDSTGTPCSTLFTAATPSGGTKPTDTVTALLNIAHNPALTTASLTNLYGLVTATGPYQPYSTAQPTDLTLSLTYPSVGSGVTQETFGQPVFDAAGLLVMTGHVSNGDDFLALRDPQGYLASNNDLPIEVDLPMAVTVDSSDHSWVVGSQTPSGSQGYLFLERNMITSSGFTSTTYFNSIDDTNLDTGYAIASDAGGNIFVGENHNNEVVEFNSSGAPGSTYLSGNKEAATGLALDKSNDLFTTSPASGTLSAISLTPNPLNLFGTMPNSTSTTNLNKPSTLAVDSAGSVWVTNLGNNTIAKFTVAQIFGTSGNTAYFYPLLIPAANAFTGGGMSFAGGSTGRVPIVMDGASAAWVPNYTGQSISAFTNSGTALSPATTGFATPGCPAQGITVDGSGNVWVTCNNTSAPLLEFLGLATPVATPILPGQLGVRP